MEPLRPGYNPATWMLEVTGGSMSTTFRDAGQDFPELYLVGGGESRCLFVGVWACMHGG